MRKMRKKGNLRWWKSLRNLRHVRLADRSGTSHVAPRPQSPAPPGPFPYDFDRIRDKIAAAAASPLRTALSMVLGQPVAVQSPASIRLGTAVC